MNYVLNRIKEPSTWTAIGAIAVLFGIPAGTIDAVHMIAGGVAALVGILLPEAKTA